MRILWLADFYPPHIGGLERHVQMITRELARRGHAVAVATVWHAGTPEFELDGDVRVYRLKGLAQRLTWLYRDVQRRFHPTSPDPIIVSKLREVLSREKPEIVTTSGWILYSFLPLKAWSGAKLIVRHHDYAFVCPKRTMLFEDSTCSGPGLLKCLPCAADHYGWMKGTAITASLKLCGHWHARVDHHMVVSESVARAVGLGEGSLAGRVHVVPAPIPDEVLEFQPTETPPAGIPGDSGFILFVGALTRHKGLNVLLEAYQGLEDRVRLVLIGTEWPDSPNSFPAGVTVIKNAPHRVVMNAFYHSLFAVVPSLWPEPFGQVAVEAMAAGKAVVASHHGGLADIVVDQVTGFLIKPGDPGALHDAMAELLEDEALRGRLGLAGRDRAKARFTRSIVTSQFEAICDGIQAENRMRGDAL